MGSSASTGQRAAKKINSPKVCTQPADWKNTPSKLTLAHTPPTTGEAAMQRSTNANSKRPKQEEKNLSPEHNGSGHQREDADNVADISAIVDEVLDDSDESSEAESFSSKDVEEGREKCLHAIQQLKSIYKTNGHQTIRKIIPPLYSLDMSIQIVASAKPALARTEIDLVVSNLIEEGVDKSLFSSAGLLLEKTTSRKQTVSNEELVVLSLIFGVLHNLTDRSENLTQGICQQPDFLEHIAENLLFHRIFQDTWKSSKWSFLTEALGVVYNCSAWFDNRRRLRDAGLVWILKRFVDLDDMDMKVTATLALAGVLDEQESKFFRGETQAIRELSTLMGSAIKAKDRRCEGWSATELATACSRLAGNDTNTSLLVDAGILSHLQKMCQTGDDLEITEALGALWALAFDKANRKKMMGMPDLINVVIKLRSSDTDAIRTQAVNVLWVLHGELSSSSNPRFRKEGQEMKPKLFRSSETISEAKHLMISYNWGSKVTVFRLHKALVENGYRVWIDKNEMRGSIIDSIAKGVENAEVLLMCVSPKYKSSKYCRAEAEYAFTNDIDIVPLLMESDYKADGWLGLIKGAKKHFDFGQENNFDNVLSALLVELGYRGKGKVKGRVNQVIVPEKQDLVKVTPPAFWGTDLVDHPHGHGVGVSTVSAHGHTDPVSADHPTGWSPSQVKLYLEEHECYRSTFRDINGADLVFLNGLRTEAPEFFYKLLDTKLKVKDLKQLSRLTGALQKLRIPKSTTDVGQTV